MSDLIDRQAALDAIRNLYPDMPKIKFMDNVSNWQKKNEKYIECENAIFALPSAQDVIRCKNCKWYDPTHPYGTVIPDAFHCKVNDRFYEVSHFCGYGERRE